MSTITQKVKVTIDNANVIKSISYWFLIVTNIQIIFHNSKLEVWPTETFRTTRTFKLSCPLTKGEVVGSHTFFITTITVAWFLFGVVVSGHIFYILSFFLITLLIYEMFFTFPNALIKKIKNKPTTLETDMREIKVCGRWSWRILGIGENGLKK